MVVVGWEEELIRAKYHFSVAGRLYDNYAKFSEKRLLVGVINEMAKATSKIIRAYLIYAKKRRLRDFVEIVSKQYLDSETAGNLMKTLEIQKAQSVSPVQFAKNDKIIMLIGEKWKILTVSRLGEFLNSIKTAINVFPRKFRQV